MATKEMPSLQLIQPISYGKHRRTPEDAVGAAGEVGILDERNILGTGKGDADVAAKGGQGLRQAGRQQGGAGRSGLCKGGSAMSLPKVPAARAL